MVWMKYFKWKQQKTKMITIVAVGLGTWIDMA